MGWATTTIQRAEHVSHQRISSLLWLRLIVSGSALIKLESNHGFPINRYRACYFSSTIDWGYRSTN